MRSGLGKAKGAIVRPMVEWFAGACGEPALRELAEYLSPAVREEIGIDAPALGLLPAGWYSEALASELADAIVRRATASHVESNVVKALGTRIVDNTLGRISRAAVEWLAFPASIAASGPIFWRMYHDTGDVSASVDGRSLTARATDWVPHSQSWCKVVGSSANHVLELAGLKDSRLWVHRCSGGEGECSMVFRWSA
jgi:hypothetical protein